MPGTMNSERIFLNGVEYSRPSHVQFIRDMQKAGLNVKLRNRAFYAGPCVSVTKPQQVTEKTTVRCGAERKGLFYLIFPQESDPVVRAIAVQNGL